MRYSVEFAPEATTALEKLTKTIKQRISDKIDWLVENFEQITPQPLSSELSGYFKLRVGITELFTNLTLKQRLFSLTKLGIAVKCTTSPIAPSLIAVVLPG